MTDRAKRISAAKLVAVGDNCLDAFLNRDLLTVGGNALNVAVQWRRAGWNARYFGAVGDDPEGDILLAEIAAAGLDPRDVERRPGDTAVTLLRDNDGDRTFLLEAFGIGAHYEPSPERYAAVREADWAHLGTNANPALVQRLVSDGVRFSIDLSTSPSAFPIKGVPLVFASGGDPGEAPPERLIAALREAGAERAVVTCGAAGAYYDDGHAIRHVAAEPVEVVDTCGAGDSFIAVFVAALEIEHLPADVALAKAAHAASQTCTYLGGFPQTPRAVPDWLPVKYAAAITAE